MTDDVEPLLVGATRAELESFLTDPPPWDEAHATAIAWVLDPTRSRLLLVDHRLHGWSCAGGHVDPGETPAAAARRELCEETGITAESAGAPIAVVSAPGCARQPNARHWAFGYLFVADADAELRPEPGQPAQWFDVAELPTPRPPDVDAVLAWLARSGRRGYGDAVTGRRVPLDRIDVHGLEVLTRIGVLPHERQRNQPIRIDLSVEADLADAGRSDELGDTVHYGEITRTAAGIARQSTDVLLERLAQRIADALLDKPRVEAVHVTVTKLRPPIDEHVETTAVRIVRRRADSRTTTTSTTTSTNRPHTAIIALGSNLGDRRAYLRHAVDALGTLTAASQVYETAPVGGPDGQDAYLNMVAVIATELDPYALLRRCRRIEAEAGRERTERWGARTLDVDILFYDDVTIDDPELTIPHPRLGERRFVLVPLAEVASERCPDGWDERLPPGGEVPVGPLER